MSIKLDKGVSTAVNHAARVNVRYLDNVPPVVVHADLRRLMVKNDTWDEFKARYPSLRGVYDV